jgi:L-aspartate oxidase
MADQPVDRRTPREHRLASLVTVGHLIAGAALRRTESRGGHFRADFPARDDVHWTAHMVERSRN